MRMARRCLLPLAALLAAVGAMARADAPPRPALIVNDPFAAPLWRLDADTAGAHLVTGSPAKAAAVWSIEDPAAPELLRVPLRDEEMQRAHAVAISPDGKRVAYSVPPLRDDRGFAKPGTAAVYIIERGSSRIEKAIVDVATRPQALRFSPDGALLAATLSDGCGLRVWRTMDWSLAASDDKDYGGTAGSCCAAKPGVDCDTLPDTPGLAFSPLIAGETKIVTSGDTGVRLYQASTSGVSLIVAKSAADIALERPEGAAISPDGSKVAIGDARVRGLSPAVKLQVAVLNLKDLTPARAPLTLPETAVLSPALLDAAKTPGADQMALNRVAWLDADGEQFIFAGGLTWCQIADPTLVLGAIESEGGDNCVVRWLLPSAEGEAADEVQLIRAGLDRVMDLAALPKRGALAYATLQRVAGVNADGTPLVNDAGAEFFAAARALDLRDRPVDRAQGTWLGFDISPDAATVYIQDYRGSAAAPVGLTFNVDQLKLERTDARPSGVAPPNRDPVILDKLANWWNAPRPPTIYGLPLDQLKGEWDTYRTIALAPDKRAVIGSANYVRLAGYGGGKAEVLCQVRVSAEAYRAAVSADGTLAVVGHSDGTLRWYRIGAEAGNGKTCELTPLLSVHIRQSDTEDGAWTWAAWQPDTGQFATDARAKELMGWQITAPDGQVSTVRFADLLQHYAPDAVRQSLRRLIAPTPDAVASLETSIGEAADPLRMMVLLPDDGADIKSDAVRFDIKADGGTTWPRRLLLATGSGARLAKSAGGKDFGPNDPIEIAAPGIVQVQAKLPAAERQLHRNVDVCFLVGRQRSCRTVNWAGPLEKPPPRTLRAVIVGLSAYKDPSLALNFAQNDALDVARLFLRDYKARVLDKTSKVAPDFAGISIDLLIAPSTETARKELADLQASGIVRVHDATVSNITDVLKNLAQTPGSESDLVLFYFSGHGVLNPFRDSKGLTALLGPGIDGNYTRESLEKDALTSDRLIELLEPVPGEKVVIIDACRTTASAAGESAFDPAAVRLEFERNLLSADFFFSAAPGQYSLDQGELAFSSERPKEEQGNGLFTYAFLKSLTDPGAAPSGSGPRKVEVYDVDRYVRDFFDSRDDESAAMQLIRRLKDQGISVALQQPMFVPSRRRAGAGTVLRTLDAVP